MSRTAFRSKNIYTGKSEVLIDGMVVIEDNKILAVGSTEAVKKYLESDTVIYDYENNFIMPGFCDFHVHLVNSATLIRDGDLRMTTSEENAAETLWAQHKDTEDKGKWILAGAWDNLVWQTEKHPKKETLDKYFPDTPVFLLNKECHGAWVNSKGFEVLGVDRNTPDPKNGIFFKDEDGELSGYIHEAAVFMLQEKIFDSMTEEEISEYTKSFIRFANQYGITSMGDVAGVADVRADAYAILEKNNKLDARIYFYPSLELGSDKIKEFKSEYHSDFLKCGGAKGFIDGTPMGYTGYMVEGYADDPGEKSKPLIEEKEFKTMVAEYDQKDVQLRIHACGDAGVRLCLDAFEEAQQKNKTGDRRHCVEHIEVTTPEDIPRFGALKVIASVQPEHMPKYNFDVHPFHKILGEERMHYAWPFGSIKNSGGKLVFGTDSPVAFLAPSRGIFRAVSRLTNEKTPPGGWNPKEKITVHEALRAYTWGGAFGAGMEAKLGTLEAGKLADLAILPHNIFDCAEKLDVMFDMKALMTVVNGKVVYEAK